MEISQTTEPKLNPNLSIIPEILSNQLFICIYLNDDRFAKSVSKLLSSDRFLLALTNSFREFLQLVEENNNIDCLILQEYSELTSLINQLQTKSTLLPAVIIKQPNTENTHENQPAVEHDFAQQEDRHKEQKIIYHQAEVILQIQEISDIDSHIEQAIKQFLKLSPSSSSSKDTFQKSSQIVVDENTKNQLHKQQNRLAEKLRERLGYLGVYYKRNPINFITNLPPGERREFLEQLRSEYRQIVLNYFSQENEVNNQIDAFVNISFFADVPVTQIVEIHMDLMDEFSKQLQIEGRSEEMLLDYRLTLIDTIAHLCEMYRRSIPKET
ncbi:MAG: circadian clock protein KaiA [Microcoleaceae cyanobacterium]